MTWEMTTDAEGRHVLRCGAVELRACASVDVVALTIEGYTGLHMLGSGIERELRRRGLPEVTEAGWRWVEG